MGAAFLFGKRVKASGIVDQLQAQLKAERSQHAFNIAQLQQQIAGLLRDLAEARYQLAQRDTADAFARAESPSSMRH
jgi:hypothetical protein